MRDPPTETPIDVTKYMEELTMLNAVQAMRLLVVWSGLEVSVHPAVGGECLGRFFG